MATEQIHITTSNGKELYSPSVQEVGTPSVCTVDCPTTQPTIGNVTQDTFGYTDSDTNEFVRYDSGERVVEVFDKLLCKLEDKLKDMQENNLLSGDITTKVILDAMPHILSSSVQFSLGMHTAANANIQAEVARVTAQAQVDKAIYERNLASVNVSNGLEALHQTQLNGVKDRESKAISDTLRVAQTSLFDTQRDGIIHKSKIDVLSNISDIWTITAVEEPDAVYQVNDLVGTMTSAISNIGSGIGGE